MRLLFEKRRKKAHLAEQLEDKQRMVQELQMEKQQFAEEKHREEQRMHEERQRLADEMEQQRLDLEQKYEEAMHRLSLEQQVADRRGNSPCCVESGTDTSGCMTLPASSVDAIVQTEVAKVAQQYNEKVLQVQGQLQELLAKNEQLERERALSKHDGSHAQALPEASPFQQRHAAKSPAFSPLQVSPSTAFRTDATRELGSRSSRRYSLISGVLDSASAKKNPMAQESLMASPENSETRGEVRKWWAGQRAVLMADLYPTAAATGGTPTPSRNQNSTRKQNEGLAANLPSLSSISRTPTVPQCRQLGPEFDRENAKTTQDSETKAIASKQDELPQEVPTKLRQPKVFTSGGGLRG
jgi:hypothetical protein